MGSDAVDANMALARHGNELWNEVGVDASVEQIWAPDIDFHEIPEAPDAAVFRGAPAVAARGREVIALAGHLQFTVRSLEGRGEYVFATLEQSVQGASSGAAVTTPVSTLLDTEGADCANCAATSTGTKLGTSTTASRPALTVAMRPSRPGLIPHRHRPRAELQPAHELQVDTLR